MDKHARKLTEFMPAALEIQAAPPPRWARAIIWSLLVLLLLAITWACLGKIDIVSVAQGKLVPNGKVKVIQPLQTGLVQGIYVQEGQQVRAGQKLIALDSQINQAELLNLQQQILAFEQDIRQYQLLLQYTQEPESFTQTRVQGLSRVLQSQILDFDAGKQAFVAQLAQLQAEQDSAQVNVNRYRKTLPLIEQRASSLQQLNQQNLVATDQYLQLEQERIEQQESLKFEQARIKQIQASMATTRQQQQAYVAEFQTRHYQELEGFKRQLDSLKQDRQKAQTVEQQQLLTSPVDGTVAKLAVATIGGVVTPAQELMQIVPKGQKLLVEAGLQNKDVGFVRLGQVAEIKLEAFPFTKYGVINGKVNKLSADAVAHEQLGLIYPLEASLEQEKIWVKDHWVQLQPGMQATVEIKTGQRRIIEFLLSPVLKGLDEGIRER